MGLGRMKTDTTCSRELDLVICAQLGPVWYTVAAQRALLQVYNQKKKKKNRTPVQKDTSTPVLVNSPAVIFTIAKR